MTTQAVELIFIATPSDSHKLVSCIKGREIDVEDCCVRVAHQELVNEVEFHFFSVHVHRSGLGKTDKEHIHKIRIMALLTRFQVM